MKHALIPTLVLAAAMALAAPAAAQDAVLSQAYSNGVIGEQADGYLGIAAGAQASADVRARVDQTNIGRRSAYTRRAEARGESVAAVAAAVACQQLAATPVGARYRDEGGAWRQRTANAPVVMPSFCGN